MQLQRLAASIHKWITLFLGIQILFWVASGLFFALVPIERVRSEHLIRETAQQPLDLSTLAALAAVRNDAGQAPVKATIERRGDDSVVVAEFAEGPPALFDAVTLEKRSPLSRDAAIVAARRHVTLTTAPDGAERVTKATPEYRGRLPAWRVRFKQDGLAVYVAEDTGAVTARRSDVWRLYDALWALHIMDWTGHEDFNHPLLIAAAALTLISTIAGIVLLPFRIRFRPK